MKQFLLIISLVGIACSHPTKTLKDDLQEFVNIIPKEKIIKIAERYLDTDEEFQKVVFYLQSPEWEKLVADVRARPEAKDFENFMLEAGIDLNKIIEYLHDLIAGAKPNGVLRLPRTFKGFLEEVKKEIPLGELLVLLNIKLSKSEDFKKFFEKVSSQESKKMTDEVLALPEVMKLEEKLTAMGVEVQNTKDFIYSLLGWK